MHLCGLGMSLICSHELCECLPLSEGASFRGGWAWTLPSPGRMNGTVCQELRCGHPFTYPSLFARLPGHVKGHRRSRKVTPENHKIVVINDNCITY